MKFILLLLISYHFYGQNYQIPSFTFTTETSTPNKYIKYLNLDDQNSLIIRIEKIGGFGHEEMFLVFQNGGKINTYISDFSKKESEILKKEIDENLRQQYWAFLYNCFITKRYKINQSQLKIFENPNKIIIVLDGSSYTIEFIQNKKYISFWAEDPESHYEEREQGYEEKEKFWNLYKTIEKLILEKN